MRGTALPAERGRLLVMRVKASIADFVAARVSVFCQRWRGPRVARSRPRRRLRSWRCRGFVAATPGVRTLPFSGITPARILEAERSRPDTHGVGSAPLARRPRSGRGSATHRAGTGS
jgi:hypothetical protein